MSTENKKTERSNDYIVLASYSQKPLSQLQTLGEQLSKRFGVEGCKIVTDDKSEAKRGTIKADDVRGKILVGNMIPSYLAQAADEVIEVNCQQFFNTPERFIKEYTDEEIGGLLSYDRSYKVVKTPLSKHLPVGAEKSM
jgi:hypothetical protein